MVMLFILLLLHLLSPQQPKQPAADDQIELKELVGSGLMVGDYPRVPSISAAPTNSVLEGSEWEVLCAALLSKMKQCYLHGFEGNSLSMCLFTCNPGL